MSDSEQQLAETCAELLFARDTATRALGIKLVSIAPGRAEMTMDVGEEMLNGHKTCHGGFIFSLADSTFAFACNSRNRNTVASGCGIDFVLPAQLGDRLTAVANERSLAGRTGLYDVTITNQDNQVVAYFRGKSYRIKGPVIPEPEDQVQ